MTDNELPVKPFHRVGKKYAKRVSDEAAQELRDFVEQVTEDVVIEAVRLMKHADRVTLKKEDVAFVTGKID